MSRSIVESEMSVMTKVEVVDVVVNVNIIIVTHKGESGVCRADTNPLSLIITDR